MTRSVGQFEVVSADAPPPGRTIGKVAFFDENGDPVEIGGGGSSVPAEVTIGDVAGLQAIITDYEDRIAALEAAAAGE